MFASLMFILGRSIDPNGEAYLLLGNINSFDCAGGHPLLDFMWSCRFIREKGK